MCLRNFHIQKEAALHGERFVMKIEIDIFIFHGIFAL